MIEYSNIQKFPSLDFEQYLSTPGFSHSTLKSMRDGIVKPFNVTDKVKVGKIVDTIRTGDVTNVDITDPLFKIASDIAECIRVEFGNTFLSGLTSQLSYSAQMQELQTGLKFVVKGRPDWELGRLAVIDLKVTFDKSKDRFGLEKLIEYMGYDRQLWNYGKLGNKKSHYLIMHSVHLRKTFVFKRLTKVEDVLKAEDWWSEKVIEYGTI
jgi:PDDEXK-like domain of unknown function (DUF3799)